MTENHRIVAIIPARFESSRLPGKVLERIGEKAMLHHVVDKARGSNLFSKVILATDHEEVIEYCNTHSIEVKLTSKRHVSGTDRIAEVARGIEADTIINIQADEPFLSKNHLLTLCNSFSDPSVKIATLKHQISNAVELHDYNKVKVVTDIHNNALYFSRQAIPAQREIPYREWHHHHTYFKHVGLYGFKKETLLNIVDLPMSKLEKTESLEQLRWLENGYKIKVAQVSGTTLGVDTPDDLKEARRLYKNNK